MADISVLYNGDPIRFTDAKPKMTGGRVLVPLRAVLEGMGVDVKFDPATNVITADQNDTVVKLRIDSRDAAVNGRPVTLDVPAQAVNGRTYIPLRFFGEAFGADVKWRSMDETVLITKSDIATNLPTSNPGNTAPVSYKLSTDSSGWVKGGESVEFELDAAPGQKATLYLNGGAIEIPFEEVRQGVYTAKYTVPAGNGRDMAFSDSDAFALVGTGTNRVAIQATKKINVDNVRPQISNLEPKQAQKVVQRQPTMTAELRDGSGSGIDPKSARIMLDNRDITNQAFVNDNIFVLKPRQDLSVGPHMLKIQVKDVAGNMAQAETQFEVVSAKDVITSFKADIPDRIEPGDQISFTAKASPDVKQVRVRLGGQDTEHLANLDGQGNIQFDYTVRKGDSFDDSPITLALEMQNGDKLEYVPDTKLTMAGATTPEPKLTSPEEGTRLGRCVEISGVAERAKTVHIKIEYSASVLGLLRTTGVIKELDVDVNDDGTFKTDSIDLRGPLGTTPDSYTITMVSISGSGRESEPVMAEFK